MKTKKRFTRGPWKTESRWPGDSLAFKHAVVRRMGIIVGTIRTGTGTGYAGFSVSHNKLVWAGKIPSEFSDLWLCHDQTVFQTEAKALVALALRCEALISWRSKQEK